MFLLSIEDGTYEDHDPLLCNIELNETQLAAKKLTSPTKSAMLHLAIFPGTMHWRK